MKKIFIYLTLFYFPFIFSCGKKAVTAQPALPPITTVGANTMGAVVDGEIWLPSTASFLNNKSLCSQYDGSGGFYLLLTHDHTGSQYTGGDIIQINYNYITSKGIYDLSDSNKSRILTIVEGVDFNDSFSITTGTLSITNLDLVNKIISGQFSYVSVNKRTNTTHIVTDGRFDLQLNHCN